MAEFKKIAPVGRWFLDSSAESGHQSATIPAHLVDLACKIREARTKRREHFGDEMFGEAAWEMLLALYIARGRGYRLKVSNACFESGAPSTTALRWLDHLIETNMAEKHSNFLDARSLLVELTDEGVARMNRYLAELQGTSSQEGT